MPTPYAELQVTSHFSFLRGASSPEELFVAAHVLGHSALGIADRGSLAGMVRAHQAANTTGLKLVVGARLELEDGAPLLIYPTDRTGYAKLCRLLTLGKRRAGKGGCRLTFEDVAGHGERLLAILLPDAPGEGLDNDLGRLREAFGDRAYLALTRRFRPGDDVRLEALSEAAGRAGVPAVVTGDVLYHAAERRILQDVVTCIRLGTTIDAAGFRRERFADRHLKSPEEMARLFARWPDALERSAEIVERARFSLAELRYQYPHEISEPGLSAQQTLDRLTWEAAALRYPDGVPDKVEAQLRHELRLIEQLQYAPYFLTVHSIVREARRREILCQGRGSAANSAVCYLLGITSIDPERHNLLFERFVSQERKEPPDIDVDFEHERREEVIQWIYDTYGRDRAALCATVIRYRARGALRDVGKALGIPEDVLKGLSGLVWGWSTDGVSEKEAREMNLNLADRRLQLTFALARELIGVPRHLSQHPGGFVLTEDRLDDLVPIEPAAMADRQVVEWDKDDIDELKFMKVDVLGLGMLGCMRRCFDLLAAHKGETLDLGTIPAEDPATYAMIQKADTVGVFQIESRAQMAMLPRLKPKQFYDLVIEVAIVRPGPIQGDMVHPYLRRREGREPVVYPRSELENVLGKTLGVPLFQEQAMRVAIECAGFTPSEADQLRRSMATFKHTGGVSAFRQKLVSGMVARGYTQDFAEKTFSQLEGFGSYGFPESHAASFALIAYASSWMKCHHPEVFCCAILNAQPMGFYAPAQLVRDAREHGVEVRPVDVNFSGWDSSLEQKTNTIFAVRLGLRLAKGLASEHGERIAAARTRGRFGSVEEVWRRAGVPPVALERLAEADAFRSLGLSRRQALWAVKGLGEAPLPLFAAADARMAAMQSGGVQGLREPPLSLPSMGRVDRCDPGLDPGEQRAGWGDRSAPGGLHPTRPAASGVGPPSPSRGGREPGNAATAESPASIDAANDNELRVPDSAVEVCAVAREITEQPPPSLRGRDGEGGTGLTAIQDIEFDAAEAAHPPPGPLCGPPSPARGEGEEARAAILAEPSAAPTDLFRPEILEPEVDLVPMTAGAEVVEDFRSVGLTLRRHPVSFLRAELDRAGMVRTADIARMRDGRRVMTAGLVLVRQRPGSAKGVMFITLEDETGIANLVVWQRLFERQRRIVLGAGMMGVRGKVQRAGDVIHVVAERLTDLSELLRTVGDREEAFPLPHGRGDEAKGGGGPDERENLGRKPRDIYIPDLRPSGSIKVKTRDFR